jgi:phage host-nuclease inhibitor protein Gam
VSTDTKLKAIDGIESMENIDVPDRMSTVGDVLRSVYSLNLESDSTRANPVRHILSMKYEDSDVPNISDKSQFQVALFLTATGYTEAYDFDGGELESDFSFDNIMCANCHLNIRAISCTGDFSPVMSVNLPTEVKSVAYMENSLEVDRYIIMDEEVEDESVLSAEGVSDDTNYTVVNAVYPEQFKNLFNYDTHNHLFDNTRFADDKPMIVESSNSTASGVLAPLIDNTDYTDPWSKIRNSRWYLIY